MEEIIKPHVLVTLDAMRYPNTGLYYFSKSLGKALLRQNSGLFQLNYYLHRATADFDTDAVDKTYMKIFDKIIFTNQSRAALFHFTNQSSYLKPQTLKSGKKILTIHDINPAHETTDKT